MIFVCNRCSFIFERHAEPLQCPNCAKEGIRTASAAEEEQFKRRIAEDTDNAGKSNGKVT